MKYLRRIIWFFANRLLALCLILGLIMTVFYYTMNLSNIQIVLKDGMANRAKYIMGMDSNRKEPADRRKGQRKQSRRSDRPGRRVRRLSAVLAGFGVPGPADPGKRTMEDQDADTGQTVIDLLCFFLKKHKKTLDKPSAVCYSIQARPSESEGKRAGEP